MIIINADKLSDGLYNVKDGQIFKYKAKGGTARTYEMGEIVRCKDCAYWASAEDYDCEIHSGAFGANDFCSYGERREDGEA